MNIKPIFTTIICCGLIAGCNSMKISSKLNKNYNFSAIQTYEWIDGPESKFNAPDPLIARTIQQTVQNALAQRNIQPAVMPAQADIQVAYRINLQEEKICTEPASQPNGNFSGGLSFNRADKKWSYTERNPDLNVYGIEFGTLSLLVYDTKTGEQIWNGKLQTQIDRSKPKELQFEPLRIATEKLMNTFPGATH